MSFGYQVLGFGSGGEAEAGNDNGIFGFGNQSPGVVSLTNLVSNTGVVGTDVTGVATAKESAGGCEYGGDKGILAFGANGGYVSTSNLVFQLMYLALELLEPLRHAVMVVIKASLVMVIRVFIDQ